MTSSIPATDLRFAMVPEWLLCFPKISFTDIVTYCHLARFADARTNECWPSQDTLAERMGCDVQTVRRAIKRLSAIGAVTIQKRRGTSSLYTVHRLPKTPITGDTPITHDGGTPITGDTPTPITHDPLIRTSELEPMNKNQIAPRARNPWWDQIADLIGEPSKAQTTLMGRLVAKATKSPVEEIPIRAERYMRAFDGKPLTLPAFEKHWEWLGSPAATIASVPDHEKRQALRKPTYRENR